MTPHRWAQVSELFAKASELPKEQRSAYLHQVCPDATLRREVESLLPHLDGPQFMAAATSVTGKLFSHYEIGDLLGAGGMGVVYRARDTRLGRQVALKFLPPWVRADPSARRMLEEEARYASALNHPNIVTVYEIAQEAGIDFIAMEYVAGQTLDGLIPPQGAPPNHALHWAIQIVDAMAVAHAADVIHGDLKPLNVMVTEEGRVKVLDFGLARARVSNPEGTLHGLDRFGTTVYMAPEQLADPHSGPTALSEIFSFGLILHHILYGRHPFASARRAETLAAIRDQCPPDLPAAIPVRLAGIVRRCLEKLPEKRFESARALHAELLDCHNSTSPLSARSSVGLPRHDAAAFVEIEKVRRLVQGVTYENVAMSRRVLAELKQLLGDEAAALTREAAITALKNLMLTIDPNRSEISRPVRAVRGLVFDALKFAAHGELGRHLGEDDLEHLDLYGISFAGESLEGISFQQCFLVESNFENCNLSIASFAGAWVRNVKFGGANLMDADLTDADWFNAIGLKEDQFRSVRRHTLLECPRDVAGMHDVLNARYGYGFKSWSTEVQEQLTTTWQEYLRPGGLRELVAEWRRESLQPPLSP